MIPAAAADLQPQGQGDFHMEIDFNLKDWNLPSAWFVYLLLGIGVAICLITFAGHIAAETSNGCCLSCYTIFVVLLILLQAAFVADVFFNENWEEGIPADPTGLFKSFKEFVEKNIDVLKWVGLGIVITEALAVLLAMCVRVVTPNSRGLAYDSDDESTLPRMSVREPLLVTRQVNSATMPNVGIVQGWPTRTDAWSSRMRGKYGLDAKEVHDNTETMGSTSEQRKGCCIM